MLLVVAVWLSGTAFAQFNYPFQPYLSQLGNVGSTFVARGFNLFNRRGFGGYYNQDIGTYDNGYNRDRYNNFYRGNNNRYNSGHYRGGGRFVSLSKNESLKTVSFH